MGVLLPFLGVLPPFIGVLLPFLGVHLLVFIFFLAGDMFCSPNPSTNDRFLLTPCDWRFTGVFPEDETARLRLGVLTAFGFTAFLGSCLHFLSRRSICMEFCGRCMAFRIRSIFASSCNLILQDEGFDAISDVSSDGIELILSGLKDASDFLDGENSRSLSAVGRGISCSVYRK